MILRPDPIPFSFFNTFGLNLDEFQQIDQEINVRLRGVNSFLVIKDGYLLYENYYNEYDQEKVNYLRSVIKTFISVLIGIAIDKHYIRGVEQKILDFFPDFNPKQSDYLRRELTIKYLLTMTAGFLWSSSKTHEPMLKRITRSNNWVEAILNLPIKNNMFGRFQYNTAVSYLLSAIISESTGMSTLDFAEKHLFKPIGITKEITWMKDPQGINIGGYGLKLTPRNLAKFGFL